MYGECSCWGFYGLCKAMVAVELVFCRQFLNEHLSLLYISTFLPHLNCFLNCMMEYRLYRDRVIQKRRKERIRIRIRKEL